MNTESFLRFIKKEAVFVISFALALGSAFIARPSEGYLGAIDFNVIMLLFCLMGVVAAFRLTGALDAAAGFLAARAGNARRLAFMMAGLAFFSAMLITNDVALITFVPITLAMLPSGSAIYIIVIETVAANLGSMLTPIGNPQNLFIYEKYSLDATELTLAMLPAWAASLALVCLMCALVKPGRVSSAAQTRAPEAKRLALPLILFLVCLASVFKLIPKWAAFIAVAAGLLAFSRESLKRIDYFLLLTFVCFFIFVANVSAIEGVGAWVESLMSGRVMLAGIAASQVISNVPAAIMLGAFTDDWRALALGVNIGGLGTLIASLASLISFKLYAASEGADAKKYLLAFSAANFAVLAALMLFAFVC